MDETTRDEVTAPEATQPGTSPDPARRRRRRRRWWIGGGIVLLLLAWGGVLAAKSLAAYHDDKQGLAVLDRARAELTPGKLTSADLEHALAEAHAHFAAAQAQLSSPLFAPVTVVPVIGRQVRAVQAMTSGAVVVASTGSSFLSQAHQVLDSPHGAGQERVASLRQLSSLCSAAATRLDHVDTGPSQGLVSPIASKHATFVSQLTDARNRLSRAARVTAASATILQGPSNYLVLAGNNAEMRAGSGAFLEVGMAAMHDGSVRLSDMQASASYDLPAGAVTVGGDLERNWGWIKPGVDWRNLGVTPRFDVTGALAAKMWQAKTGQHVDGVLALDIQGLQQLLRATGPVQADGVTVNADNAVQYLMHDQYEGLTDSATAQAGRKDALGALAKAVVSKLEAQTTDLKTLASAVADAAQGRHLLVWSADAHAEAAWVASGVSGRLGYDSVAASVINRGGNKLDQYLPVTVSVRTAPTGSDTTVTMRIHLRNETPSGQSQYIAGPYPGTGAHYGEYVGLVAVNLPGAARHLAISGGSGPPAVKGADGPTWAMAVPVRLAQGSSATVTVTFRMPGSHGAMSVVPSARIPAEHWTTAQGTFEDSSPRTISW